MTLKISASVSPTPKAELSPWKVVGCCGEAFHLDPATGKLHAVAGDPDSAVHVHDGREIRLRPLGGSVPSEAAE